MNTTHIPSPCCTSKLILSGEGVSDRAGIWANTMSSRIFGRTICRRGGDGTHGQRQTPTGGHFVR